MFTTIILLLTNYCLKVFRQRLIFPGWAWPALIFSRVGGCPPCPPRAGAHVSDQIRRCLPYENPALLEQFTIDPIIKSASLVLKPPLDDNSRGYKTALNVEFCSLTHCKCTVDSTYELNRGLELLIALYCDESFYRTVLR